MIEQEHSRELKLLTFTLSGQEYALDIMSVREIRRWTKATLLPHAPKHVEGVINLRGTVLPVLNLCESLGIAPRQQGRKNVIVVVQHNDMPTGLLVDDVSDIIALSQDDLQVPPNIPMRGSTNVVSALTLVDDRMIRILNLQAIVATGQSTAA